FLVLSGSVLKIFFDYALVLFSINCITPVLINPAYQGKGIGKELVRLLSQKYKEYLRIVLIAYEKETEFYRRCGFEVGVEKVPMFITSLWT
ncbi:MAG: GNAT family N-acetyltransferase, partial [Peptococcaceae bacterium]|nr:GNAT family N-acetyltransferase [Peptococcaceae bacterium]